MAAQKKSAGEAQKSQADFFRKLNAGQISPLYLLEGAETYLRDQALKKLIEKAVDASVRDFNLTTISVSQGDLDEAIAIAQQFPMISPYRAVVVTGFENINDEKQLDMLRDYLRNPSPTTLMIFVSEGLDNRRNIATMLRKSCTLVSFERLDERDAAPRWLMDYVSRSNCFMDAAAAAYLIGMIGTDLRHLTSEADKLINFAGGKGRISQEDIEQVVRYSREHSNFEITDAITEGNRRRALELLDHIFSNPSETPQTLALLILGAIAGNFRRLLIAKEMMQRNASFPELAKAVGLPDFIAKKLNERARRYEISALLRGMERIAATDFALKNSRATPRLLLETLICELCPSGQTVSTVRYR
jgi:DNA polymerase-3 subunit delta